MSCYNAAEATRRTNLTHQRLKDIASKAEVNCSEGFPIHFVNQIIQEQTEYIGFREFAASPRGKYYNGSSENKNKLLEVLERNDFFGVDVIDPEDILLGTENAIVYFKRCQTKYLEECLVSFFDNFAFPEHEKFEKTIAISKHKKTVKYLRMFTELMMVDQTMKPSYLEFTRMVLRLPDVTNASNDDIKVLLDQPMTSATQTYLVEFFNYVKRIEETKYSELTRTKKDKHPLPAYSDETYLALARYLFNPKYIADHRMIEQALDNHWYIEMWLYLSLHYVCGWRAGDICNNWQYLKLKDKPQNEFGINKETLYNDILYDRVSDEVYEKVCKYVLNTIEASGEIASKTAGRVEVKLVIAVSKELSIFFGLLTLISEAVMLRTGEGYMKANRCRVYQHKRLYEEFFGDAMVSILHGRNIQSRRLNKDFLQGIEKTAREEGCGPLMASAVASFARSHNNLDSITHYLRDHKLNDETAEMVLYFMLERGVFAVEQYRLLLVAYPNTMQKLPMKKQNELIVMIEQSPLEIEIAQSEQLAKMRVQNSFMAGETDDVMRMLKAMYEIGQWRGLGKDEGIHCLRRAKGEPCTYPEYESCLANACPHLVFSTLGYKTLLDVIVQFKTAADAGDVKKRAVLHDVIMPRFRYIINTIMREANMSREERAGMEKMMREELQCGNE